MTAPHPCTTRTGAELRILRASVFAAVCVVLAAAGHSLAACAAVPLWTLGAGFLAALVLVAPLAGRNRSLPGIAALLALGQIALHTLFGLAEHAMGATASGAMSAASMRSTATGSMGASAGMSDQALVARAARLLCGSSAGSLTPAHAYRLLADAHLATGADLGSSAGTGMSTMRHAADATGSSASLFSLLLSLLPSLPMLLGHLIAAVAVGWLLRRGDLAVLRLLDLSVHGVAEGALVRSLRGALALARALCAGLPGTPDPRARERRTASDDAPAPHTTALQHTVIRRGPPPAAALDLAA
ncbi:hypothetical protein ABZ915_10610 [Streptomyces sp. NPDC046915]|uniref:hypothetical protein n=1 Tax=Streptomyces sp. NPDC046915 TaxID=3155257 RepID=UPI0033E1396D